MGIYVHEIAGASGGGAVTTNVLSLVGANLKSIVDGVQSNTVVIPGGGAITNSLVNNGDNTLTSDVNGQISTADIILTASPTKPDTNHIAMSVNGIGNTQVAIVDTVTNSAALNQMSVAVNGVTGTSAQIVTLVANTKPDTNHITTNVNNVSSPTPVPIIDTNALSLVSNNLKATINGVDSNTVVIPSGGATTNVFQNNGDNTMTSTVDGIASTDNIIDVIAVYKFANSFSVAVNGLDSGPSVVIDTVELDLTGSDLTATVNGVVSAPVDLSPIIPPTTTNTLINNGDNTLTSTVDGVASTDNIIDTNGIARVGPNALSTQVNGLDSGPLDIIDTTALVLTGTLLKTTINSLDSNTVDIQVPIASPTNDNLVAMDATGHVKDAGVSVTHNSLATSPFVVMAADAVATALATKINVSAAEEFNGAGNTPFSIAKRDTFGELRANLANFADVAGQIGIGPDTTDTLAYPVFVNDIGPSTQPARTNTAYNYNAVTNTLSVEVLGYAKLASPAFTGNPTAPTQLTADNSTKIATTELVTAKIAAIPATPTTNTFTNNILTNTMTSTVNGVSSSATLLSGVSASFNGPNSLRVQVNDFISDGLIIGSHSMSITSTTLTDSVNGVSATAQVAPSAQSPTSSITFTNLDEIIVLVAPSVNATGIYTLRLYSSGLGELNIVFSISGNLSNLFNQSTINIIQVTDSAGIVTSANLSNFILFRGYVRSNVTNGYFAMTLSVYNTLLFTNPLSMTIYQSGASYLNENSTITSMITTSISNLVTLAPADLIFNMRVNVVQTSVANPQGYVYFPASGSNAIFQPVINLVTGALTANTPASFANTSPYKLAATKLRNYVYVVHATGTSMDILRVGSNGTLSSVGTATVPNTSTGVTVDPTDRFVYTCGFGTGVFGQFSIIKATGLLTAIASPPTAAVQMQDLVCHPSGKFLYAINNSNGLVYQYSINQSTGALVALGTPTISAGAGPIKIIVHPNGQFAYVVNNNGGGAGTISVFGINTSSGQLTLNSTFTPASAGNMQGACISNNGLYIIYTTQTGNLIASSSIDQTTGAISALVSSQALPGARDCCFDYSGAFLYGVNNTNNRIDGKIFNQITGVITNGANLNTGANASNIIAI